MSEESYEERPSAPPQTSPSVVTDRREHAKAPALFRRLATTDFLVVLGLASLYSVVFAWASLSKFQTFHATWFDLGINTQLLWVFWHSGYSGWVNSGQNQVLSFPFTRLSYFILLPMFVLDPRPAGLLILQPVLIGAAAIPLYFVCARLTPWGHSAVWITSAYLLNFSVQEANLFDFHFEALFPLAFFTLVAAWLYKRKILFAFTSSLVCLLNPLASAMLFFFYLQFLFRDNRQSPSGTHKSSSRGSLNRMRLALSESLRKDWQIWFGIIVLVFANGIAFYLSIGAHELGGGAGTLNLSYVALASQISSKIWYFVILGFPSAFLFLVDPLFLIAAAPYAFYLLFSYQTSPLPAFEGDYPFMLIPVLVAGAAFGIFRLRQGYFYGRRYRHPRRSHPTITPGQRWRRINHTSANISLALPSVLLLITLMGAIAYSPLSFYNSSIPGGYFEGNYGFYSMISPSHAAEFLSQALSLIPPQASVLTQNNIPQLAGREYAAIVGAIPAGFSPDYIVADSSITWFTNFNQILPYLQQGLMNGTYGILAIGDGAYVLEKGYYDAPRLFAPYTQHFTPNQVDYLQGKSSEGTFLINGTLIHNATEGPAGNMWYGPYTTLPPGDYTVTFQIEARGSMPQNSTALGLDVVSGPTVYANSRVSFAELEPSSTWRFLTLDFHLSTFESGLEFRGYNPTGDVTLMFGGEWVNQTGA